MRQLNNDCDEDAKRWKNAEAQKIEFNCLKNDFLILESESNHAVENTIIETQQHVLSTIVSISFELDLLCSLTPTAAELTASNKHGGCRQWRHMFMAEKH